MHAITLSQGLAAPAAVTTSATSASVSIHSVVASTRAQAIAGPALVARWKVIARAIVDARLAQTVGRGYRAETVTAALCANLKDNEKRTYVLWPRMTLSSTLPALKLDQLRRGALLAGYEK